MVVRVGNTFYTIRLQLILIALAVFLGLLAVFSMFFTVQAENQVVVLRFGRYVRTADPGLRFKLPFGIEQKLTPVPVERQLKQEFGFATGGGTNPFQASQRTDQELARNMVTGDLNAASVEWVVQYRVTDPRAFLFNFLEPEDTLRDVSESVMREVVGDRTVDEVITVGRQEIEIEALVKLQEVVKAYDLGISIIQLQLKNVNPPQPVQASFNEVNQAQQEREKSINVANGEYNKIIPRARGEAQEKISTAEGYAVKRINEAEGDATRFIALFTEYSKAPEVTRRRIYLETMKEVMPAVGSKVILDEAASQVLPLLQLNRD